MSIPSVSRPALSGAAVALVATLISIYIVSQFLRNSIGVIAPDLAGEVGLSAAEIGLLSSTYFFVFAAVQIPLGVVLDRFGPRLCLLVGAGITVVGTAVFAAATSPGALLVGRALLGLGTAGSLVASLAVYARRFAPERFAALTGLQVGLGTIGTLLATAPLAVSAASIGWRASFLLVGVFTLMIALLIALVLRDERGAPRQRETMRASLSGIIAVMRTPSLGRLFVMNLSVYSTFTLIVGLWGGPYLTHVYGYGLEARGNVLLVAVLAQIAGSVLWGAMDRVIGNHKVPVLVGAGASAAALGFLALIGTLGAAALVLWFAVFGLVSAFTPLLLAHGKALLPMHQVGRGLTVLNMGLMGGAFLVQAVSGFVIGLFPTAPDGAYELVAYRAVFAQQGAFIILASLAYFGASDPLLQRSGERQSALSA